MSALTIARFTLQEAISRRLVLAALVLSGLFLALFSVGFLFLYGRTLETAARTSSGATLSAGILTTMGLYAVYFLSSVLALFLTVGAISGEIDSGLLHAVLARPIRRAELVIGRWLGFALLISLYVVLMASLLLLIARAISGYLPLDALWAIGLMTLSALLLLSLSLLGSTLWPTLANGVVAFTLFGLAWLAGIIEWVGGLVGNHEMVQLGIAVSLVVPSDAIWRGASYFAQSAEFLSLAAFRGGLPFSSFTPPAPALLIWAGLYPLVALGAAAVTFGRRDL